MSGSRKALGRGISALIPKAKEGPEFFECALERIQPMTRQPRQLIDDGPLQELSESIKESGLLQPLVVRRSGSGYTLIAGERRWRASRAAGLERVPVIIREASDSEAFALALVENLQRQDLSPLEMAEACQRLLDEYGYTQDELAKRIGKSRSAVANNLRLLKLNSPAKEALASGAISEGHARQLVGLAPEQEEEVLEAICEQGLSVRATEEQVRELRQPPKSINDEVEPPVENEDPQQASGEEPEDEALLLDTPEEELNLAEDELLDERREMKELGQRLSELLGMSVKIKARGNGEGQLQIHYGSYAALEELVQRLEQR